MCTMYISLKAIIIVILRFTQKFNYILFFIFILWLPNKDEILNIKPIKLSHSPHENTWLQITPSICLLTFFLSKSLRQKAFKTNNTSVDECTLPCLDLKSLFKKRTCWVCGSYKTGNVKTILCWDSHAASPFIISIPGLKLVTQSAWGAKNNLVWSLAITALQT